MLNVVAIMGRLTADPELRKTPSGVSVTAFTVAVDRNYVPQGQERQADFFDCVAWRGAADTICKYFTKGKMIALNGALQTRLWEDKNGNKRKNVEILVDQFSFCGDGKREGEPRQEQSRQEDHSYPSIDIVDDEEPVQQLLGEDLPF